MSKLTKHLFLILMLVCILSGNQTVYAQTKSNPGFPVLEYSDFISDDDGPSIAGFWTQWLRSSDFLKKTLVMKGFDLQSVTPKKVSVNDGLTVDSSGEFIPINPRTITVCDSVYFREVNGNSVSVTICNDGDEYNQRFIVEFSNPQEAIVFDDMFKQKYFQIEVHDSSDGEPEKYKGDHVDSYLRLPEEGSHPRDSESFVNIARIKNRVRILSNECWVGNF